MWIFGIIFGSLLEIKNEFLIWNFFNNSQQIMYDWYFEVEFYVDTMQSIFQTFSKPKCDLT